MLQTLKRNHSTHICIISFRSAMKNQLKSGVLISYATMLVSNIIPMIYTPIMLRILGQAEYGVYGIAQSISNYLY